MARIRSMLMVAAFHAALGPVPAASESGALVGFLDVIGGSTDLAAIDAKPDKLSSPEVRPLARDAQTIAGYRFFRDRRPKDGSAVAMRAREAFEAECEAAGGLLEPEESPVHRAFYRDRVVSVLPPKTGRSYDWLGFGAVCSGSLGEALGGFVAIVYDTSNVGRGNPVGEVLMHTMPVPTRTAVYAYPARAILSRAYFARAEEERRAAAAAANVQRARDRQEDEARQAMFRKDLSVGSQTNCGMVIELRGDIVQVQAPAHITPPGGERIVWVRRDRLRDNGPCSW